MHLDGVEVKINVHARDISAALDRLDVDDDSAMRLWFYEDLTPGVEALPLLRCGLILRVRARTSGTIESTVKLRPCRLSQLTPAWGAGSSVDGVDYTVEEDRSTTSRTVAASCTAEHDQLPADPPFDIADLLVGQQLDFLATCAAIRVNLRALHALGPIAATRWKQVGGPDYADLKPRAERWIVGEAQFLEISVRADVDTASAAAARLKQLLAVHDLAEDDDQQSKTSRVLQALAGQTP